MDLVLVAAAVLGYLIFVAFVLTLLVAAKRADEASEREHRVLKRAMRRARVPRQSATEDDPDGGIAVRRIAG
jgi:hypothetical protein